MADSPCDGVDGDGPGLIHVLRDEHLAGRPVEASPPTPIPLSPPPPVADSPRDGVEGDGPGLVQVLRNEHLVGCPVEASPPTPTPPAMGSIVMAQGSSRSSEMSTLRAVPLRPHSLPPPPPVANSPCDGVDGDGPGLVQVLRDEHLAGRPVEASFPTPPTPCG